MFLKNDVYEDEDFQKIKQRIISERITYKSKFMGTHKYFSFIAMLFSTAGTISLLLILLSFFDIAFYNSEDITIFHTAALYLISYVREPTDGDRYEEMIKGIAEDIGNVRALIEFENTNKQQSKEAL